MRFKQKQAQLNVMRTNVEKELERNVKLSELNDRADALQQASQFEVHVTKLKRKYWWQKMKVSYRPLTGNSFYTPLDKMYVDYLLLVLFLFYR